MPPSPYSLPTAFIKTYDANIRLLVQQTRNKFRDKVTIENLVGQKYYVDFIGTLKPTKRASAVAPTTHVNVDHTRRRISAETFDLGIIVDRNEILRMGTDPTNKYMQAMRAAYERDMDSAILSQAIGNAIAVVGADETESNVALPATQLVAETGTVGGTAQKIKDALKIFNLNDVEQDQTKYLAISPYFLDDLLGEPDMSLADREALNIIRTGQINNAFGFTVLMTNRLADAVANIRTMVAWTQEGLCLGIQSDVESRITIESQFNFAVQMWMSMDYGATRLQEKLVVGVQSYES